jgi:hypothetical protein
LLIAQTRKWKWRCESRIPPLTMGNPIWKINYLHKMSCEQRRIPILQLLHSFFSCARGEIKLEETRERGILSSSFRFHLILELQHVQLSKVVGKNLRTFFWLANFHRAINQS